MLVKLYKANYSQEFGLISLSYQLKTKTFLKIFSNPKEFFLIIRITAFLAALPFGLRINRIQDLVSKITPTRTAGITHPLTLDRIIYLCDRLIRIFTRFGYHYSCLRRCLLLYHFLRCYRVPVSISFGAKWKGDELTGHSWLTLDRELYLENEDKADQFTPFFSLPLDPEDIKAGGKSIEEDLSNLDRMSFD